MKFTEDYLFENYSNKMFSKMPENNEPMRTELLKLNSTAFKCSLHTSEIYLFKMNDVEAFIKDRLSAYLRKDGHEIKSKEYDKDGYRYIRYFIDINALEKHCRGDVTNKLWQCKNVSKRVMDDIERRKDPSQYDYQQSQQAAEPAKNSSDVEWTAYERAVQKEQDEKAAYDLEQDPGKDVKMEDGCTYGEVRDADAYEQLEVVILSKEYAALVSTWNFITSDDRFFDVTKGDNDEEIVERRAAEMEINQVYILKNLLNHMPSQEINAYIKPECKKEVEHLCETEHYESVYQFIEENSTQKEYRKYFVYLKNSYSNSISMLLDVMINESLGGEKFREITFIYPKEGTLAQKRYDLTNGWGVEDFCDTKSAPSFKYVVLNSNSPHSEKEGEQIRKDIESYLSSGKEDLLAPSTRYNLEDSCYTCSLPDGQSVVIFNIDFKTGERRGRSLNYLDYRIAYIEAVYKKCVCTLIGEKYNPCLKSMDYDKLPEENETDVFLGRLKLLKNDICRNISSITPDCIATLWYKKTNTLDLVNNLETICNYLVDNARDRRSKKQQNILGIISIVGVLALIAAAGDCWGLLGKDTPTMETVLKWAFWVCAAFIIVLLFMFFDIKSWRDSFPRKVKKTLRKVFKR